MSVSSLVASFIWLTCASEPWSISTTYPTLSFIAPVTATWAAEGTYTVVAWAEEPTAGCRAAVGGDLPIQGDPAPPAASATLGCPGDTAMLSWKPAKLDRRRDGAFEIEFGLRNAWIQRGLDEGRELDDEGHRRAGFLAGVFVVGSFFEQGRRREDVEMGGEHLVVAMWRLLKLAGS